MPAASLGAGANHCKKWIWNPQNRGLPHQLDQKHGINGQFHAFRAFFRPGRPLCAPPVRQKQPRRGQQPTTTDRGTATNNNAPRDTKRPHGRGGAVPHPSEAHSRALACWSAEDPRPIGGFCPSPGARACAIGRAAHDQTNQHRTNGRPQKDPAARENPHTGGGLARASSTVSKGGGGSRGTGTP